MARGRKRPLAKSNSGKEPSGKLNFEVLLNKSPDSAQDGVGNKRRRLSTVSTTGECSENANPQDRFDFIPDLIKAGKADVHPKEAWEKLQVYKSFKVQDVKFDTGDLIEVNWSESYLDANHDPADDSLEPWIARVIEIKALDDKHVYLRVAWFYWPDELPMGRQYYHGIHELVESNHHDIIDPMTVIRKAELSRWDENDDEAALNGYYYRQQFDFYDKTISPLKTYCICNRHQNPDLTIVYCPSCDTWMHERCIVADAINRHDHLKQASNARNKLKSMLTASIKSSKSLNEDAIRKAIRYKPGVEVLLVEYSNTQSKLRIKLQNRPNDTAGPDTDHVEYIINEDIHCLRCRAPIDQC